MGDILILVVVFVIVGALWLVLSWVAKQRTQDIETQRREHFRKAAEQLSWRTLSQAEYASIVSQLADFHLGSRPNGEIKNVIQGEIDGQHVYAIDYLTGRRPDSARFSQRHTVVLLSSDHLQLPEFILAWRGTKSGGIMFPQSPQFSKAFALVGDDETAIRAFFSSAVVDFFIRLDNKQAKHTMVEGDGRRLLYYRTGEKISDVSQIVRETQRLSTLLIRHR